MIPCLKNIRNSIPKEFTVTSIHVLCLNFKEIGRREAGDTMHCFADKKFEKRGFSPPFASRLRRVPNV